MHRIGPIAHAIMSMCTFMHFEIYIVSSRVKFKQQSAERWRCIESYSIPTLMGIIVTGIPVDLLSLPLLVVTRKYAWINPSTPRKELDLIYPLVNKHNYGKLTSIYR